MIDLKERPECEGAFERLSSPAVGCFGYRQPKPKPNAQQIKEPSIFAALFANSL